jgi:hypothetical protein
VHAAVLWKSIFHSGLVGQPEKKGNRELVSFAVKGLSPAYSFHLLRSHSVYVVEFKGYGGMQPQGAILHGKLRSSFNFNVLVDVFRSLADLPQDAVVVDVEGGVGWTTLPLAKEHPHLQIIIQDQAEIVTEGQKG